MQSIADLQAAGRWTSRAIKPIDGPRRGQLAVTKSGDLLIILPATSASTMAILKATKASGYEAYKEVWAGQGITGEPLVDSPRLETEDILSVLVRRDSDDAVGNRDVAVLDFVL